MNAREGWKKLLDRQRQERMAGPGPESELLESAAAILSLIDSGSASFTTGFDKVVASWLASYSKVGKVLGLFCLFALSGCMNAWWETADFTPRPNQAEAVSLVWTDYGVADVRDPPRIGWYEPECSYTDDAGNVWQGYNSTHGYCDQGDTIEDSDVWTIVVVTVPSMHESALPHELCHAASFLKGHGWDPDHLGPCFVPGGPVDQEKQKLTDLGI